MNTNAKIVIPGGAGLVGQNLVARLKARGYKNITVIDKHRKNIEILKNVQPDITVEYGDLAEPGEWTRHFIGADSVIMLQAQIGGNDYNDFIRNNVESTRLILNEIKSNNISSLVHVSSSVVESRADDYYTRSKKDQECMVLESGIACPVLRPTLMFGWFDRKHLGWLSRLMKKIPVFPIPGDGKYMRQPLYAGDFSNIIIRCVEDPSITGIFNISGHEKIDYIDIIKEIKRTTKVNTVIMRIPFRLFYSLIWIWGLFDKTPPFTTQQLSALSAKDEFEVINWPEIFCVPYTPFTNAIDETFNDPVYSKIVLEF
ncbi:NAD-dependent dehydratase [Pseudomonas protegens]|uniref:NAD-dependent epimerase/dehydratase family protein n=1 Tax=Pseudomonas protegens TaxID=380021 RepID=UPI0004751DFA|nr:NAD-dependent epimerase/dehydratase family protein [Pseudomonas protegens]ROM29455.1 NAD-dependent dehydratase [Pseudomonas protegens]ROM37088.1 NAD-dependent dehydratase [Pseudomonas protegens]URN90506.1 MAG: NAD-dependent epimerase/dehydratase family protein [Pseudomonas protegens]WEK22594.1 MAG: NAD-dependent epimerase/dehydratase family protein [Pseudomonas protegens]